MRALVAAEGAWLLVLREVHHNGVFNV